MTGPVSTSSYANDVQRLWLKFIVGLSTAYRPPLRPPRWRRRSWRPFWEGNLFGIIFWFLKKKKQAKGSVVNLQRKKRLGPRWRLCQHSVFNANINSGNGPLLGLTNAPCSLSEPVINVSLGLLNLKGIFLLFICGGGGGAFACKRSFFSCAGQQNKTHDASCLVPNEHRLALFSEKKKNFLPQRSDDVCKYQRRQTRPQLKVAAISKIINCVPRWTDTTPSK